MTRIVSHRSPTARIPFSDAPQGTCRWCGEEILRDDGTVNARRRWHEPCVEAYRETWPAAWRKAVLARDGGVCVECPHDTPHDDWQADHILPLIDGGDWTLDNAQTLCPTHHRVKTSAENSARAARRKVA